MQYAIIDRPNLADTVADAIREMIVDGRLADGERINEVQISAQLGVSRTPLREALNRLTADGSLFAKPRHGYFVSPLTADEFVQVYDLRPILDPAALRLAGPPRPAQLDKLEALNKKLDALQKPERVVACDDEWHRELLAHCPNRVLLDMIESMIRRTRRYELALMRERKRVLNAADTHRQIMTALRRGDLDRACAALERNMREGREPILEWLAARTKNGGTKKDAAA
ncbi:MAG: GntR family transcriptional regulator [Alphaproteobacteria bacterium]|nr:GntR family transcriptional regulator [Alphaproteobacteria bacterium]